MSPCGEVPRKERLSAEQIKACLGDSLPKEKVPMHAAMDSAPAVAEARPTGQSVGWLASAREYFPSKKTEFNA